MIIVIILIGAAFIGGWIALIHLAVRDEVRFEDKKIKKSEDFLGRYRENGGAK